MVNGIPNDNELNTIAYLINNELENFNSENMSIVFKVSPNNLKKLDEHYFQITNPTQPLPKDFKYSDEEINIEIDNIKFKFLKDESISDKIEDIIKVDDEGKTYFK